MDALSSTSSKRIRKPKGGHTARRWTQEEVEFLKSEIEKHGTNTEVYKTIAELTNRTVAAIDTKVRYGLDKPLIESNNESQSSIPLGLKFLKKVTVEVYKALDDSLHESPIDATRANIRTILDSYDEVRDIPNISDKDCHQWFITNKEKINYLLNTSPEEIWNN